MSDMKKLGAGKWLVIKVGNNFNVEDAGSIVGKSVQIVLNNPVVRGVRLDERSDATDSRQLLVSADGADVTIIPD